MPKTAVTLALAALAVGGFSLTGSSSTSSSRGVAVAKASGYMKGYVTLSWAPASEATGYLLFRDSVQVSTAGAAATSARFYLQPGTHEIAAVPLLAAATTSTTTPTTAPTSTATPAGHLSPFGAFDDGTVCGDVNDCSQNFFPPHVTVLRAAGPNGENVGLFAADDTVQIPSFDGTGQKHVRIHGVNVKGGLPEWFGNGRDVWRGLTVEVPPGYTNGERPVIDETHGDNGTGPAPYNLTFQRGGYWRIYVRGSTSGLVSGGYPFAQWIFGPSDGGATYDGATYRHQQDWAGGNKPVVAGETITFRLHWHLDTTQGSFEAWAYWAGSWHTIVPAKTGIPTSYPDVSGDGHAVYPMMSLYYDAGSGGQNAVEVMDGAWSDDGPTLTAWQDARLGITG